MEATTVAARIEDFLRSIQRDMAECERDGESPEPGGRLVLGDWVMVLHFIDPEDSAENWYRLFSSPGLSPHALSGLLSEGNEL